MLTVEQVAKALPVNLKKNVNQSLVDRINNAVSDPVVAEEVRNNFLSYSKVLADGRFKIEDYLNAVMYVSYKLMNMTNEEAYSRTFPQRYQDLLSRGATPKEISAYVSMYNKGKLVNLILEQTLVPTWVLNQDIYQKAINTLANEMVNARSELVRVQAANSILTHLKKPEAAGPLVNIDMTEQSGVKELKDMMVKVAQQQRELIASGAATTKDVAALAIVDAEVVE